MLAEVAVKPGSTALGLVGLRILPAVNLAAAAAAAAAAAGWVAPAGTSALICQSYAALPLAIPFLPAQRCTLALCVHYSSNAYRETSCHALITHCYTTKSHAAPSCH